MTIEAYAKINLTLEVLGTRPDGYHALRSVVIPTTLSDTIRLEKASGVSSDFAGGDDLCVKAAKAILPPSKGVRIEIEKRIPSGGGLGGGSADAFSRIPASIRPRKKFSRNAFRAWRKTKKYCIICGVPSSRGARGFCRKRSPTISKLRRWRSIPK